jgi:hypothetical protein
VGDDESKLGARGDKVNITGVVHVMRPQSQESLPFADLIFPGVAASPPLEDRSTAQVISRLSDTSFIMCRRLLESYQYSNSMSTNQKGTKWVPQNGDNRLALHAVT